MKIKTKLILIAVLPAATLLLASILQSVTDRTVETANNQAVVANELAKNFSDLSVLFLEYHVYTEPRVYEQWWLNYRLIANKVTAAEAGFTSPEECQAMAAIKTKYLSAGDLGARYGTLGMKAFPGKSYRTRRLYAEQLVGRILQDLHSCTLSANTLHETNYARALALSREKDRATTIIFGAFTLFIPAMTMMIIKSFFQPLDRVITALAAMGAGDLDRRISVTGRDEISRLAVVVNQMADARRRAENTINALNAGLEQRIAERTAELARANIQLEKLAMMDGLTGLANRRHLDDVLDQEVKRSRRKSTALSFLMCDIDFFKQYNDHYGHAAGDACLQKIAKILRETFKRGTDLVSRYGGEEFAVIIPDTSPEHVRMLAERLRQHVMDANIVHGHSTVASVVTISVGIVSATATEEKVAAWFILQADNALYQSKAEGRNRVT